MLFVLLLLVVAVAVTVLEEVLWSSLLLSIVVALTKYQYHLLCQLLFLSFSYVSFCFISIYHTTVFFWESRMEIKLHSFFVLSLTLHFMENFFTTVFYFSKFTFVYVVNIRFICDGETYLLTGLAHTNFVVTSQFTDKISYLKPLHS